MTPQDEVTPQETLRDILPRIKSDCDHIRYSCEEIGCWNGPLEVAIRAVLEENERLRDEVRVLRSDRDAVTFERNQREAYIEAWRHEETLKNATLVKDYQSLGEDVRELQKQNERLKTELEEENETWAAESDSHFNNWRKAEAYIEVWQKAESLPDCPACAVFDAALRGEEGSDAD